MVMKMVMIYIKAMRGGVCVCVCHKNTSLSAKNDYFLRVSHKNEYFYRTRVRSLGMLVTNSLTNSLTHSCY